MNYIATLQHDEVRAWMEEHGGKPGIHKNDNQKTGTLAVIFDDLNPDVQSVSWEEFFDAFESNNMIFCYDADAIEPPEFAYSFADREELALETDSEMEMPEDDVPEENLFPSAPVASRDFAQAAEPDRVEL